MSEEARAELAIVYLVLILVATVETILTAWLAHWALKSTGQHRSRSGKLIMVGLLGNAVAWALMAFGITPELPIIGLRLGLIERTGFILGGLVFKDLSQAAHGVGWYLYGKTIRDLAKRAVKLNKLLVIPG